MFLGFNATCVQSKISTRLAQYLLVLLFVTICFQSAWVLQTGMMMFGFHRTINLRSLDTFDAHVALLRSLVGLYLLRTPLSVTSRLNVETRLNTRDVRPSINNCSVRLMFSCFVARRVYIKHLKLLNTVSLSIILAEEKTRAFRMQRHSN